MKKLTFTVTSTHPNRHQICLTDGIFKVHIYGYTYREPLHIYTVAGKIFLSGDSVDLPIYSGYNTAYELKAALGLYVNGVHFGQLEEAAARKCAVSPLSFCLDNGGGFYQTLEA